MYGQEQDKARSEQGQETVRINTGPSSQDTPPQGYTPAPSQSPTEWVPPQAERGYSGYAPPPPPPPYAGQPLASPQGPPNDRRGRHKRQGVPILGPVLLILAGVLFLLNNLEVLPWSVWGSLWKLWPLVLIAIGLDMLVGRRSPVLSALLVLGVLGAGAGWLFSTGGFDGWDNSATSPFTVPAGTAQTARVEVGVGSGVLRLGSLPGESNLLADGTIPGSPRGGTHGPEVEVSGTQVTLKLESEGSGPFFFFEHRSEWDVRLKRGLPISMGVDIGSGDAEMDLRELRITNFDLDIGSGDASITLPTGSGSTDGQADVGSGNLTFYVPEGVSVEVRAGSDSGNVHADSAFRVENGRYLFGENANDPGKRVTLQIDIGSGDVYLRTTP